MTPKVSVIIPVYNVEDYLPRCLDSLVNQTLKDIEIICVNDGSTDNSLAILQDYAAKDDRIKIIDKENSGPGDCRNRGIEAAKGEFIAFVDSDDWVELNTYEETYKKAKGLDVPLLSFNACIINRKFKKTEKKYYNLQSEKIGHWSDFKDVIFKNPFHSCHFLFKKTFLDHNNIRYPSFSLCEDVPFILKSLLCAEKIYFMSNTFYYYFQRKNSLVHKISPANFDLIEIIPICKELIKNHGNSDEILFQDLEIWKREHLFKIARRIGTEINYATQNFFLYKTSLLCTSKEINSFIFNIFNGSGKIKLFNFVTLFTWERNISDTKIRLFNLITIIRINRFSYLTKIYLLGLPILTLKRKYHDQT